MKRPRASLVSGDGDPLDTLEGDGRLSACHALNPVERKNVLC